VGPRAGWTLYLREIVVRMGGVWNWLRIVSSGGVERWGSAIRDLREIESVVVGGS